ncbi:hypothetical protein B296_00020110 [Ensete ventricosum]|uniref:Uncharacterized protein n=1 Tax=Ensete ventricosum TaxID=4639 RepID=A0A426YVG7_ENSVE|nr:hypothetical protein B296_00020110 [Ensete ventricosum]
MCVRAVPTALFDDLSRSLTFTRRAKGKGTRFLCGRTQGRGRTCSRSSLSETDCYASYDHELDTAACDKDKRHPHRSPIKRCARCSDIVSCFLFNLRCSPGMMPQNEAGASSRLVS